jgi:hypothetical protein
MAVQLKHLAWFNLIHTHCCARLYSFVLMIITHNGMDLVKNDCNEWKTEKCHECTNTWKVKQLKL